LPAIEERATLFNISDFVSNGLVYGGARPTLFAVTIQDPFGSPNAARVPFLCRAASIPPAPLDIIRVPYFGRNIKLAGDREFPEWTVTVFNDEDFPIRILMERWSNEINALVSNRMDDTMGVLDYKQSATVTEYGKQGAALRSYAFVGIFPVNVEAMQMDWSAQNRLQEFDVTFAYDYWQPVSGDSTAATNGNADDDFNGVLASDGTETTASGLEGTPTTTGTTS
jgi:hypothetical protein